MEKISLPHDHHVVIWGLRHKRDTFRYIHRAWVQALSRSGRPVTWVDDDPRAASAVDDKAIVVAVNVAAHHIPRVRGARYVLHNIDPQPFVEIADRRNHVLQLQVWSEPVRNLVSTSEVLPCVALDLEKHVLYQPWGTPFPETSWKTEPLGTAARSEFWIGSVWDNPQNQGNESMIREWRSVLQSAGIHFRKVPYGWPDTQLGYGSLVRRSRLAAAVVGDWQKEHGYVPCRLFKNISFGAVPIGNSPVYRLLLGDCAIVSEDLCELLNMYLCLSVADRRERIRAAQVVMRNYTYESAFNRILEQVL